jgi:hypothetical protein
VDYVQRQPTQGGRSGVVLAAMAASIVAAVLCGAWLNSLSTGPSTSRSSGHGALVSSMYSPAHNAVERALDSGDGQIFAAQSTDPLVRHTSIVTGPPSEQAYRYQRPLYGWIGWITSAGQRDAVGWALIIVTALAVVGLVTASARLLARWGADPLAALVLLATPGVIVDLTWVGPEALGAALVVVGLGRMLPGPGPGQRSMTVDPLGLACLAAAGLCRETLLLVPAVLVVLLLLDRAWRPAVALAATALPYAAWVGLLRLRIGAWPTGSEGGRISLMPFGGLVRALPGWGAGDYVFALVVLGGGAVAVVVTRHRELRWLIGAHLVLAATLGAQVWTRFADFGRVLLPLNALSVIAVAVGWPNVARGRAGHAAAHMTGEPYISPSGSAMSSMRSPSGPVK